MGMNDTPASERVHIAFFGRRNAGKSSVMNALTGQELAVVSPVKGTTTDPVYKTMELLPLGPVVLIDTPGFDDQGELGELRVKKSRQILNKTDVAVLVVDGGQGITDEDRALLRRIEEKEIPHLILYNKLDAAGRPGRDIGQPGGLWASAATGEGIQALKERLAELGMRKENKRRIVGNLLRPSDIAILVVPIDKAAPKGRLILPQQQTIRDILDADAAALVVKENELKPMLEGLGKKPRIVITDSQVFESVSRDTPPDIPLTSFSILFARYKGDLELAVRGAAAVRSLRDGDRLLIAEGCTHHRQCGDIGTVKLPQWIRKYTGKNFSFDFVSGTEFPEDLKPYRLIVHCGGCMLNEREMRFRQKSAKDQGIPITNYGVLLAMLNGILERSLAAFEML